MGTDTPTADSGALTQENLILAMHRELGGAVPDSCPQHPKSRSLSMLTERGRVKLVTFDCGCCTPVIDPDQDSHGRHSWRG